MTGQLTLGHRHLADRGALSTQLRGDGEGQVAGGPHLVVRLVDERAVPIVPRGVASDPASELGGRGDELALRVERSVLCSVVLMRARVRTPGSSE